MWYENTEEENAKKTKTDVGSPAVEETPADVPLAAEIASSAFPKSTDPTKAFEEDLGEDIPDGAATVDELTSLKNTIQALDKKAALNYDRYLRALAELENYKKRMTRERMELMRTAGEDLLLEILPVVDNLERTLLHLENNMDVKKVLEGVQLIYKQFLHSLGKSGVTRIEKAPCAFDPTIHQALQKVEDKSVPDDTVVEILQKGYMLHGKVIRPAMVKVAKHA